MGLSLVRIVVFIFDLWGDRFLWCVYVDIDISLMDWVVIVGILIGGIINCVVYIFKVGCIDWIFGYFLRVGVDELFVILKIVLFIIVVFGVGWGVLLGCIIIGMVLDLNYLVGFFIGLRF